MRSTTAELNTVLSKLIIGQLGLGCKAPQFVYFVYSYILYVLLSGSKITPDLTLPYTSRESRTDSSVPHLLCLLAHSRAAKLT